MFIETLDNTYTEQQHFEPALAPRQIRNPRVVPLDTQQNQKETQKQKETYCGGLFNRDDYFITKVLKVIFIIPLFPFIVIWKLICWLSESICNCFQDHFYPFLEKCCARFQKCLESCCTPNGNVLESCKNYVGEKILNFIQLLGRCSQYIMEKYVLFAIFTIMKCAHLRSQIEEIMFEITLRIFLQGLEPLYYCFYNYFIAPIIINIYNAIKWVIVQFYNKVLLGFFYQIILVNLGKLIKLIFFDYFYLRIIIPIQKCIKWLLNYLYEKIFTPIYKCTIWFLKEILYKMILLNIYKGLRWIVIEIFYKLFILKIFPYMIHLLYLAIKFIILGIKDILSTIFSCILTLIGQGIQVLFS